MPAHILIVMRKEIVKNFGSVRAYSLQTPITKDRLYQILKGQVFPTERIKNILVSDTRLQEYTRRVFANWWERENKEQLERKRLEKYEAMEIKDLKKLLVQVRQVLDRKTGKQYREKQKELKKAAN